MFGVLGPVRARAGESEVAITARRERTLLAALLLQPNRVVPLDQLVDAIWPAKPPRDPRGHVQGCVHRLRQLLASAGIPGEVIVTGQGGYRAVLHPEQLDLLEFRRLVAEARAASGAGRPDQAAGRYHAALALWRGPALSDVDSHLVRQAAAALDEERLQVLEERIRADLGAGAAGELVGELTGLIRQHPHREGLHGALMLALYRSGRQADALAAYRHARDLIRDELGSEPGPELQKLHQAILRHDPALVASPPRRPKPAGREAPVPRELPADVAGFTGRTGALKALDEMSSASSDIAAGPVVISAIAGTAGVGKTAVAVHWAHRVADRFPDGQPYLNLRGYSSGEPMRAVEALAALLRSLGTLPERIPTEEDQAAALYRTVMADRRVLVVLDNARSVDQVRPLLPGSHGCLVLVTSRDRLAGLVARNGARQLSLDVLPPEEAFALLTRILGADRTAAEPAATAELARVCAYLPLALRIAAAHLSDRTDLVIAAYIAELADSDPVTSLRVDGDDETAVRTALDRSYLSLPEPTRRMFRLLGVVPGPDFTAMAAAALAGSTVNDAAQHLRNLARAHLIDEYTPGRYTFHDLLRVYARELAIAEKDCGHRTPVIERLLSYYLHSADSAVNTLYPERLSLPIPQVEPGVSAEVFGDRHGALTWLASEQANLVAAVVHAADHGPLPFSWLLAVCLRRYFFQNRHTIDWMLTANAALRAAAKCADPQAKAAAHQNLADLEARISRHQKAVNHYDVAVGLARRAGWMDGEAAALSGLGLVYRSLGQLPQAVDNYEQSLALHQLSNRLAGQAMNSGNLGVTYFELGHLQKARKQLTIALNIYRRLGAASSEAISLNNVAAVLQQLGLLDEARGYATSASALYREIRDYGGQGRVHGLLAEVCRESGSLNDALNHLRLCQQLAGLRPIPSGM